jgi:hypothetical protein
MIEAIREQFKFCLTHLAFNSLLMQFQLISLSFILLSLMFTSFIEDSLL